jgi:3',5'-cyclic AMP phosphodiesterase CpdA
MRTVAHLSDLHFGRASPRLAQALMHRLRRLAPDVVAISGDLTQRARRRQFLQARAFIDALPAPHVVVPGNHDVPLYNVFARGLCPLAGFRRWISDDLQPSYADSEIVIAGINTTRSLTLKGGLVRERDVGNVCRRFSNAPAGAVKIVVAHHPFDEGRYVEKLTRCGTDVFLTGHLHVSYAGGTATRYRAAGRSAIVVEAGTAISTRMRGELNGFTLLQVLPERIDVVPFQWRDTDGSFTEATHQAFTRVGDSWTETR